VCLFRAVRAWVRRGAQYASGGRRRGRKCFGRSGMLCASDAGAGSSPGARARPMAACALRMRSRAPAGGCRRALRQRLRAGTVHADVHDWGRRQLDEFGNLEKSSSAAENDPKTGAQLCP